MEQENVTFTQCPQGPGGEMDKRKEESRIVYCGGRDVNRRAALNPN